MFLSEIPLKCSLFHLCSRKYIPKDIMLYLYKTIMNEKINIENEIKLFYKNIYLFKIFDYRELTMISLPACLLEYDLTGKDKTHESIYPSLKTDIFKSKLPDNRNIEWAITKYINSNVFIQHDEGYSNAIYEKKIIERNNLLLDIKIFGEKNYLIAKEYGQDESFKIVPINFKLKLKYLNNEPRDEVCMDYLNYLEWKDTPQHNAWQIYIDNHGQGSFL